jgi:hypothetical protein
VTTRESSVATRTPQLPASIIKLPAALFIASGCHQAGCPATD